VDLFFVTFSSKFVVIWVARGCDWDSSLVASTLKKYSNLLGTLLSSELLLLFHCLSPGLSNSNEKALHLKTKLEDHDKLKNQLVLIHNLNILKLIQENSSEIVRTNQSPQRINLIPTRKLSIHLYFKKFDAQHNFSNQTSSTEPESNISELFQTI